MQRSQICGALACTISKVARSLACAFPDVTASTSDIATGAPTLFLRSGLARWLIWRWS
jgi:hypothetical protein